jgi:hypothetical protein
MMLNLTRKQVDEIHALMLEYSGADEVTISYESNSGIGTNVYATVRYTACREHTIDITDYENW